ncbi:MAG: phosphotransferase [Acidimicrobiales bacterium]|nr:phosphotransferase [Acidimicrobiales bacterium]
MIHSAEPTGAGVVFPSDLEELTPHVLGAALAARAPDVVVERVDIVAAKRCGDGVASTADRVVVDLTYATGTGAGLPRRLILKTMLATPHAPAAMYENEVRFYREIRDDLGIETPTAFASHFDPATGRFGLLLEDLTARGARFPSALDPVSLPEVRSILGHLATLHARFWDSPRFGGDLEWVATPTSGGMFDVFDTIGFDLIDDQVSRHPFKADLIAPLGRDLSQMWELLWHVQQRHTAAPTTLLHGDPHLGNTYLLPGGRGGLLDWQLMMRGSWAHDVTYLLVTALEPDVRRAHQRDLLGEYLELLGAAGVDLVPSPEAAFAQMREAALWGLVIGWLICPPENYGPEITTANIERTVAAVEDLESFAAIEASSSLA